MDRGQLKDAIEIVGMVAIVASLIFVGVQLRQEHAIALADVNAVTTDTETALEIAIADHAESLRKANAGEELSEAEYIVLQRIMAAMYRTIRSEATSRRTLGQGGRGSILDFVVFLKDNPGARKIWQELNETEVYYWAILAPDDTYRADYREEILSLLAELDEQPQ